MKKTRQKRRQRGRGGNQTNSPSGTAVHGHRTRRLTERLRQSPEGQRTAAAAPAPLLSAEARQDAVPVQQRQQHQARAEADASPARVLARINRLLPRGTWERLEWQRNADALEGHVPRPEDGWIYRERLEAVLVYPFLAPITNQVLTRAEPQDLEYFFLLWALPMLALWRMTRGVYHLDPTLLVALAETKLDRIPLEVLKRLPEYAPYLDLSACDWPGYEKDGRKLRGAWLAVMPGDQIPPQLRVVALYQGDLVGSCSLTLTHPSLLECLEASVPPIEEAYGAVQNIMRRRGLPSLAPLSLTDLMSEGRLMRLVLSIALYLCSDQPDMTGVVQQPQSHPKKKYQYRYVVPQRDNVLEVGYRQGGAIRRWREQVRNNEAGDTVVGPTKAPHIRRAHWALSWTGPGRTVPSFVWRPPTAVNVRNLDTLPVHVRAVCRERS